ncbi:MAG: hypothetical protein ABIO70_19110 [Pseudomonadota bacterium]
MRTTVHDLATSRARLLPLLAARGPHQVPPLPNEEVRGVVIPFQGQPVFGGEIEDASEPNEPGRSRRSRQDRFQRLQTRAWLYAHPDTPCTAGDVAEILGLREGDVRAARPESIQPCGRGLLAPFGHWKAALEAAGLLPVWGEQAPADTPMVPTPAPRARGLRAQRLANLGGPRRS